MEEIKLSKKTTIKILIISIAFFVVSVLGVSYAYFGWQFLGNDEASSLTLLSKELKLRYTDTSLIMGNNEFPGWSQTKTITVENYGNGEVLYNFIWKTLYNTVQKGDLVIRATCSSNKGTCDNLPEKEIRYAPNEVTNSYIHGPFTIDTGEIQTYTLTLEYKETGSNQSYNNGASFHGTINISEGADEHPLYSVMKTLAEEGTYASTYSGSDTNDSYGRTGTKKVYYVRTKTADNATQAATILNSNTDIISGSGIRGINVKFAGYCWQILRTTDTGGVKLIYNGEYVEGTGCYPQTDTEHTHKGIIGTNAESTGFGGMFKYSDTFTYNISTGEFTLVNPIEGNYYSDKSLLRKYSCRSSASTCTTLYYLNSENKSVSNAAYCVRYTIGDTENAQIGTSPFNEYGRSPAYVGYMFGDTVYEQVANSAPSSTDVIMGKDVYWDGSNYVLKDGDNDSSHTYSGSQEANYHYTCNTTSATCTGGKVRYYYLANYYTELTNGDKVEDAISKMLTNSTNTHDSAMKAYLENWYYNNLRGYEDYLDQDAVYCNDRSITSLGGWSKSGSLANTSANYLQFNNYGTITTLGCTNNTDKFSVSNANAQLKYSIGLATSPEMNLINNSNIRKAGQTSRLASPSYYSYFSSMNSVNSSGSIITQSVPAFQAARPVITLAPANYTVTGSGSLSDPYVVGE